MTGNVQQALANAIGQLGGIDKDEKNPEQGFMFRSIDTITGALRPLLAEAGIVIVPNVLDIQHTEVESKRGSRGYRCVVQMAYQIVGPDGSTLQASMVGEAVDYGDKSTSKAVQMAFKYLLTELCMVGSGDRDHDAISVGDVGSGPTSEDVLARTTNRLKADLWHLASKNADMARTLWEEAASMFGLGADDVPPDADTASAIYLNAVQALQEQKKIKREAYEKGELPEDQQTFEVAE